MFISPGAEWCEHKAQMGHWFDAQPGQNAQPSVSSIYRSKLFKLRCWAAFFYNLNLFGGPRSTLLLFAEMLMRRRLSWRLCLSNSAFIWSPRFKFWQDARTLLQKAIDEGKACCLASRILISRSCCSYAIYANKKHKNPPHAGLPCLDRQVWDHEEGFGDCVRTSQNEESKEVRGMSSLGNDDVLCHIAISWWQPL